MAGSRGRGGLKRQVSLPYLNQSRCLYCICFMPAAYSIYKASNARLVCINNCSAAGMFGEKKTKITDLKYVQFFNKSVYRKRNEGRVEEPLY